MEEKKKRITRDLLEYINNSIFTKPDVFSVEYIPPILKYRDKYVDILMGKLAKEIFHKTNFNIFGMTGSGKTVTVKYCFIKIKEIWENIEDKLDLKPETLYIPCSDYDNQSKILSYMINKLGGEAPTRGWDKGTYLEVLKKELNKYLHLIVCFDEADILIEKDLEHLIFSLSDISKISLIFISNVPDWNKNIDPRIRSRLQIEDLEFRSYSDEEIKGILLQRIDLGLRENIFSDKILEYIIQKAYYNRGDLRDVIKLLNIIIEELQYKKVDSISKDVVNFCYKKLIERETLRVVDCLSPPLRLMLLIISNLRINKKYLTLTTKSINEEWNNLTKTGKIYEPITRRQTLNHLNSLEMYKLISIDKTSFGRGKGVKNVIQSEFNEKLVYNHLYNKIKR